MGLLISSERRHVYVICFSLVNCLLLTTFLSCQCSWFSSIVCVCAFLLFCCISESFGLFSFTLLPSRPLHVSTRFVHSFGLFLFLVSHLFILVSPLSTFAMDDASVLTPWLRSWRVASFSHQYLSIERHSHIVMSHSRWWLLLLLCPTIGALRSSESDRDMRLRFV